MLIRFHRTAQLLGDWSLVREEQMSETRDRVERSAKLPSESDGGVDL